MAVVNSDAPLHDAAWLKRESGIVEPTGGGVIEAIHARRSVSPRWLVPPGPGAGEIEQMADAAAAAPDHGLLGPARLIRIRDASREALGGVFEAALLERQPEADAEARAHARGKAHNGATLLVLIARVVHDHPYVPEVEQWISVGAALQNVLLSAESLGYRAKIVSGPVVRSRALSSAFRLRDDEHAVGFIAVGTPERLPKTRAPRRGADILTKW